MPVRRDVCVNYVPHPHNNNFVTVSTKYRCHRTARKGENTRPYTGARPWHAPSWLGAADAARTAERPRRLTPCRL
eukprot:5326342-Prymnesium_polylepis.1